MVQHLTSPLSQLLCIYTTTANEADARAIARAAIERKLVACVHITPIASLFMWDNQLQEQTECQLMLKTCAVRYDEVVQVIKQLHPYQLPAIYAVAVERSDVAYAAWVEMSCCNGVPN